MLFSDAVFIGLDPTSGRRPMSFIALDSDLKLLARDQADIEGVLAFVAGQETAVVAIDAPQGLNSGMMEQQEVRRRFNLNPDATTWAKWRVCEFELRRRNIRIVNTPTLESLAPGWVRQGFEIYRRLEQLGFRPLNSGKTLRKRTFLEVHPHACFSALLERQPFPKVALEGRLQRQLILFLEGLDVTDPMRSLEEITQHHLMTSRLPLEGLLDSQELDALVGAYTAYLAANHPERITQLGDYEEGLTTLPVAEVKDFYP